MSYLIMWIGLFRYMFLVPTETLLSDLSASQFLWFVDGDSSPGSDRFMLIFLLGV